MAGIRNLRAGASLVALVLAGVLSGCKVDRGKRGDEGADVPRVPPRTERHELALASPAAPRCQPASPAVLQELKGVGVHELETFLDKFRRSVQQEDCAALAGLARFPLKNYGDGPSYQSAEALLARCKATMSAEWKAVVANTNRWGLSEAAIAPCDAYGLAVERGRIVLEGIGYNRVLCPDVSPWIRVRRDDAPVVRGSAREGLAEADLGRFVREVSSAAKRGCEQLIPHVNWPLYYMGDDPERWQALDQQAFLRWCKTIAAQHTMRLIEHASPCTLDDGGLSATLVQQGGFSVTFRNVRGEPKIDTVRILEESPCEGVKGRFAQLYGIADWDAKSPYDFSRDAIEEVLACLRPLGGAAAWYTWLRSLQHRTWLGGDAQRSWRGPDGSEATYVEWIDRAVEAHPESAELRTIQAEAQGSIPLAEAIVARKPDYIPGRLALAANFLLAGNFRGAEGALSGINERTPEVSVMKARLKAQSGDFEGALETLPREDACVVDAETLRLVAICRWDVASTRAAALLGLGRQTEAANAMARARWLRRKRVGSQEPAAYSSARTPPEVRDGTHLLQGETSDQ